MIILVVINLTERSFFHLGSGMMAFTMVQIVPKFVRVMLLIAKLQMKPSDGSVSLRQLEKTEDLKH